MTNMALSFASCLLATQLSSQAVYFIKTGGSALSNRVKVFNFEALKFYGYIAKA